MKICFKCYKDMFEGTDNKYHITIKPDPKKVDDIYQFIDYLMKKPLQFFIVKCMSPLGYVHFHGIISFNESQTLDNKVIKAIQRRVNRGLGFLKMDPLYSSLRSAYEYIRASNNTADGSHEQEDFVSYIPEHCMLSD